MRWLVTSILVLLVLVRVEGQTTTPGLRESMIRRAKRSVLLFRLDSSKGNFKTALDEHILYMTLDDSALNLDQEYRIKQLAIKYASEKKDRDIQLLTEQERSLQVQVRQNTHLQRIVMGVVALLVLTIGLLYRQFRLKKKSNEAVRDKNSMLERLIEEKGWLLREVHHRVKNNLHTVICLLESQARYLEGDALEALEYSQHRIYVMSLIHQKLYQSKDLRSINMGQYVREYIRHVEQNFDGAGDVGFNVQLAALRLGVTQAIPLALILNEVIILLLEHADVRANRQVMISMDQQEGDAKITIWEDGVENEADHLPVPKLIDELSADMGAKVVFHDQLRTKVEISFVIDKLYFEDVKGGSMGRSQMVL